MTNKVPIFPMIGFFVMIAQEHYNKTKSTISVMNVMNTCFVNNAKPSFSINIKCKKKSSLKVQVHHQTNKKHNEHSTNFSLVKTAERNYPTIFPITNTHKNFQDLPIFSVQNVTINKTSNKKKSMP
jgi:hypothetical protein